MRIISGKFKGKKILEPTDIKTRPLKDLTKESIFNIIIHSNKLNINLQGANILDLFSGVGSFGIECLSREAKKVFFVENYNGVLSILKKNIYNLGTDNFEIIEKDIYIQNIFKEFITKFDLIFLDPPYNDKNIENLFNRIKKANILKNNGIIILHRHKKDKEKIPQTFKIIEEKKYGISKILFISN